jgi:hypothetical protein
MKTAHMRSGLLVLLVLLAVTAACTNSEQLNSGVGPIPIEIEITNPETRFDRAFFDLTQVTVRPLNPNAEQALGTNPLWMMQTTSDARFEINLNAVEDGYATNSQLTVGTYELESVTLQTLEFADGERLGNETCADYVTDYPIVQSSIQLVDFGEPIYVDVKVGTNNQLKMVIDGDAMATAFANSWNCAQGAPLCGFFPPVPDWCVFPLNDPGAFRADVFASQATTFVSFP